jgi:hypothetical protein
MLKRFAALAVVGLVCAACAMTAPVAKQIQNSFPIDKPFDPVWQAVIETFGELNLSIMNMEKASALITTNKIDFSSRPGYADCGNLGFFGTALDLTGKINVYVKRVSDNACEVKVNAIFELRYKSLSKGPDEYYKQCVSTGKLEGEIFKRIQEKLK